MWNPSTGRRVPFRARENPRYDGSHVPAPGGVGAGSGRGTRTTVGRVSIRDRLGARLAGLPGAVAAARLVAETVRVCLRYRVTGLASEAGFFALLSLPPLLFGLFGGVGYVALWLGPDTVARVSAAIQRYAGRFLTDDAVREVIVPTVDDVLRNGRSDVISIGLLLSVWSGSRALNVFVDTISIMYGQSGVRGIVRTRTLSLSLYLLSVVVGGVVFPLVLLGPSMLSGLLPPRLDFLGALYWPVVVLLTTASTTTLFHISTPRRTPWRRDIPGAVLTLAIWVLSSYLLRAYLSASIGGSSMSIYGPLAAPIVVLIWLYFLAIAVLIGAALNAATRTLWPAPESASARARLVGWAREETVRRRQRTPQRPLTPMPETAHDEGDQTRVDGAVPGRPEGPSAAGSAGPATGSATGPDRLDGGRGDRLLSVRTPGR